MRLSCLLLTGAAASLAAAAPAQEPQPTGGLADLQDAVNQLTDEPEAPPPPPSGPAANAPPLTQAQIAEVNRAVARGRELIAIARAGILATQDMLSRVENPEQAGIDGWIAVPEGNAMTVTFYDNTNEGPKSVYSANVLSGRVVSRDTFLGTDRPPLSRVLARLVAAREAARALDHRACTPQGFNYLVVPPATAGGSIDVYQISAQPAPSRFPLGGHFRTTVDANGAVSGTDAFGDGCPEIETGAASDGQPRPPAPIAARDAMPTELHVLLSQMSARALIFTAGQPPRQWIVAGDRINEVRDGAPRLVNSQD